MKYFAISFMLVFTALITQAQTNIPPVYTYKPKLPNDSLEMFSPNLQTSMEIPLQNNMPVLQLKNEGVKTGSNNLGEIYSMNTDQMPCLKPFRIQDEMPNGVEPKPILPIAPEQKK